MYAAQALQIILVALIVALVVVTVVLIFITLYEEDRLNKFRLLNLYGEESGNGVMLNFSVPENVYSYDARVIFQDAAGYYYMAHTPAMRLAKKDNYRIMVVLPPVPGPLTVRIVLLNSSAARYLDKLPLSANHTYQLGTKLPKHVYVIGDLPAPVGSIS